MKALEMARGALWSRTLSGPSRPCRSPSRVALPSARAKPRQNTLPIPPVAAEIRPFVVIAWVSARVEHGVDRARPAQRAAPRLKPAPPVQPWLRHGVKGPVVDSRPTRDHRRHKRRCAHEDVATAAAGLDQADASAGCFAEPCRHDATGRAAANDDVVIIHAMTLGPPVAAGQAGRCVSPGSCLAAAPTGAGATRPWSADRWTR